MQGGISVACLEKWIQICRFLLPLTIPTSDPIPTTSCSFPSKSWQILLLFPQSGPWERWTWLDWIFHFYCCLYYPLEHSALQLWHRHQQPHQKSREFGSHPNCLRNLPQVRRTFLRCFAHWAVISPLCEWVWNTLHLVQHLSFVLQWCKWGWSIQLADLAHAVHPSCCLFFLWPQRKSGTVVRSTHREQKPFGSLLHFQHMFGYLEWWGATATWSMEAVPVLAFSPSPTEKVETLNFNDLRGVR